MGNRIYVFEGSDGSGKTTLIKEMSSILYHRTLRPPFMDNFPMKVRSIKEPTRDFSKEEKTVENFHKDRVAQYEHVKKGDGFLLLQDRSWVSTCIYNCATEEEQDAYAERCINDPAIPTFSHLFVILRDPYQVSSAMKQRKKEQGGILSEEDELSVSAISAKSRRDQYVEFIHRWESKLPFPVSFIRNNSNLFSACMMILQTIQEDIEISLEREKNEKSRT